MRENRNGEACAKQTTVKRQSTWSARSGILTWRYCRPRAPEHVKQTPVAQQAARPYPRNSKAGWPETASREQGTVNREQGSSVPAGEAQEARRRKEPEKRTRQALVGEEGPGRLAPCETVGRHKDTHLAAHLHLWTVHSVIRACTVSGPVSGPRSSSQTHWPAPPHRRTSQMTTVPPIPTSSNSLGPDEPDNMHTYCLYCEDLCKHSLSSSTESEDEPPGPASCSRM